MPSARSVVLDELIEREFAALLKNSTETVSRRPEPKAATTCAVPGIYGLVSVAVAIPPELLTADGEMTPISEKKYIYLSVMGCEFVVS